MDVEFIAAQRRAREEGRRFNLALEDWAVLRRRGRASWPRARILAEVAAHEPWGTYVRLRDADWLPRDLRPPTAEEKLDALAAAIAAQRGIPLAEGYLEAARQEPKLAEAAQDWQRRRARGDLEVVARDLLASFHRRRPLPKASAPRKGLREQIEARVMQEAEALARQRRLPLPEALAVLLAERPHLYIEFDRAHRRAG